MSKRYFELRFYYILKLLKDQWNVISKETQKHLKINTMKTTYNKSFKTKLKVIKVASITSIKKANTSYLYR